MVPRGMNFLGDRDFDDFVDLDLVEESFIEEFSIYSSRFNPKQKVLLKLFQSLKL